MALRNGQDVAEPLDSLHDEVIRSGDPHGVYGNARALRAIGVDDSSPFEILYLCPTEQCARYRWPEGLRRPRCAITGAKMRRAKL
jgi:hypothetical protein